MRIDQQSRKINIKGKHSALKPQGIASYSTEFWSSVSLELIGEVNLADSTSNSNFSSTLYNTTGYPLPVTKLCKGCRDTHLFLDMGRITAGITHLSFT